MNQPPISNTTLVLTGGGMRCAWSAGFLYGLNELNIRPACIVASSGNAGSAFYFCAGQLEAVRRIWTEHLPGNRFISFQRLKKIIDIDYLIDTVLEKKEPVDWYLVRQSSVHVLCPIREVGGVHVKMVSNEDVSYECLRAAKALPVLYGKKITLDGRVYRDYAFSPADLATYAPKSTKIVVLDVRLQNTFFRLLGKPFMHTSSSSLELPPSATVISPYITAHVLTSSPETLTQIFEEGRTAAAIHKDLFLHEA